MSEASSTPRITEYVATDVASFTAGVVLATKLFGDTHPWYRGHREASWGLVSGIHRGSHSGNERNLTGRFRLGARARRADCPSNSAPMDWLFLMQHYGLPTRLLDWSMSPLVALWFALSAPSDGDAAVWCLAPDGLNESEAGIKSLFMPGAQPIRRLAMQAFRNDVGPPDTRIVSVLAEEADPRHMVQQAAFTMHGRSEPLESVDGAEKYLVRIRIPSAKRAGLKQVLGLYGITRASLFPDLENLARHLLEMGFAAEVAKESPEEAGSSDS